MQTRSTVEETHGTVSDGVQVADTVVYTEEEVQVDNEVVVEEKHDGDQQDEIGLNMEGAVDNDDTIFDPTGGGVLITEESPPHGFGDDDGFGPKDGGGGT